MSRVFTSRFSRTLIIGVLGAVGVVVWSGCGTGEESRYYCDGSGCFTCDAYGCSTVRAPAHPTCSGTASCGPGKVCTSTGCTTGCASDSACPKGETCQSGFCAAPGADPGSPKECTTQADCGAGKTCASGVCKACGGTAGPCPCTTKSDCTGGLVCVAGACTAPENTCKYSSECGDGKICADGQCLSACSAQSCAAGTTCVAGVCKPDPSPGGGVSCTSDGQCGDGKYCNQGVCAIDTRPKPNCTSDAECGGTAETPKKCLDGFCKYTCTDSQHCLTIDNRIAYCAKDGVCRTAAEANAECLGPGECGAKTCIDNQCR